MRPRIVMMAGGTGGHIFPALAVAELLKTKGWDVHWLGTKAGLESTLVPKAGFTLHTIRVSGLRRTSLLSWVVAPFKVAYAIFEAFRVLHRLKPNVVLGMGGFASGPGGVAAWLRRCPLIIHEQNAVAGLTNRSLAFMATQVLEAFPGVFPARTRARYIGNPIREELLHLPPPEVRLGSASGPLRVLVLGGSRGAKALNTVCPKAFYELVPSERPSIWHQTGAGQEQETAARYQEWGIEAKVEPFIHNMAAAYEWADLVVCRAGALTISELTAVGVGSILIPFPYATDDHQTLNAQFLEKKGAAILIPQAALQSNTLAHLLFTLSAHRDQLLNMAHSAYQEARRTAALDVATLCEETAHYAE